MPRARRRRTSDVETGEDVNFSQLLLPDHIVRGLQDAGFHKPSPIQLQAIPLGRFGTDLVAQAKSGTGKTCVFGVVALERISTSNPKPQVLIITPTREIALQVHSVIVEIGKYVSGLVAHAFIGGLPLPSDFAKLNQPLHIAVATPGRMRQLIEMGKFPVDSVRLLVFDEADRLMDEQVYPDVNWIFAVLPPRKQVLAFSATYPPESLSRIQSMMRTPQLVALCANPLSNSSPMAASEESVEGPATPDDTPDTPSLKGVRQFHVDVSSVVAESSGTGEAALHPGKVERLLQLFASVAFDQCIIFCTNQPRAQAVSALLNRRGFASSFIAGGLPQPERIAALAAMRQFKTRVLVSTDLTSRGIDMDRVNLVVNFDFPWDSATYLHRVGRTGRFGTYGLAVSLVDASELLQLRELVRQLSTSIPPLPEHISPDWYHQSEVEENGDPKVEHNDSDSTVGTQQRDSVTTSVEAVQLQGPPVAT